MQKPIQIFRAGVHRAENGQTYSFSEADVAAIAAAYDPALHAAPIVLGHPKTDDPAFGWVKGLTCVDGALVPEYERVNPAFAEGVESGAYRYTSIKLYGPGDPGNPKPGGWYPRHVGYLGAAPPAIKGLAAPFAEGDPSEGVTFAQFADPEIGQVAGIVRRSLRSLRDWMIGKFGQEEADKAVPQWNEEWAGDIQVTVRAEAEPATAFAEGSDPLAEVVVAASTETIIDPLAARAAELDARETALAQREAAIQQDGAAFAESALRAARDDDLSFVDQLVTAGRLPPGHRDGVLASLAHARGDTDGVAFSEGVDAHAALRGLLGGLGQSIAFAEFAQPDGFTGEVNADRLAQRAGELVAEARTRGETLSYADAVRRAGSH